MTLRAGWYTLHDVLHEAEFIALMKAEADDITPVWCKWSPGTESPDFVPKNNGNLDLVFSHFRTAANAAGTAWARWAPGTSSNVRGDIQIDMQAANTALFVIV